METFAGIEKAAGVCGGSARIRTTRIPVWILEESRRMGISEEDLLESYPSLTSADLANAWAYVSTYPEEIETDIRENNEA